MQRTSIKSRLAAIMSGGAFAFVVIAAQAAMDQSRDPNFENEKLAYMRQYAWPKDRISTDQEILFTKKESGKPAAMAKEPDNTPAKESNAEPPALPPPPPEGQ